MSYPGYTNLYESGELRSRIRQAFEALKSCTLCPRRCGVNRQSNKLGFCRSGKDLVVYSSCLHFGEEPPISGDSGSGTIFFSNCNLRCVYCQNFHFSQLGQGEIISPGKLAVLMINLQEQGCRNINLVNPVHFLPQILQSLELAAAQGLGVPIVYNTSGYESFDTLKLLDGLVDIYLSDLRYSSEKTAQIYSGVNDYWRLSRRAIKEMYRQVGNLELKEGIAYRGLIIRHLVLPEGLAGTGKIMNFLSKEISSSIYVSLMRQYYPAFRSGEFPPLNRQITDKEYKEAKRELEKSGIKNGWFQDELEPGETKEFCGESLPC